MIAQAKLGLVTARAVLAQGAKSDSSDWDWQFREWDIEPWFWDSFTQINASAQNWEQGVFSGRGRGPDGRVSITLTGVYFRKDTLQFLLPALPSDQESNVIVANKGGRPPLAFGDEMMCAIWALIYQGDLKPKNQAEIERAMLSWASSKGHSLGETAAREKARKVFVALTKEVENPGF